MALLAFAMSSAEKDALGQGGDALGGNTEMNQTYRQGMLSDSLMRGEITLAVKELRWRLYKVLSESENRKSNIVGYDKDGLPIVETSIVDKYNLSKVVCDDIDDFPVEMVVRNHSITKSTLEAFKSHNYDKASGDTFNLVGETKHEGSVTLGEVSFDDMVSMFQDKNLIYVDRELRPKFELEAYAKKMIVKKLDGDTRLLEFYVSVYPDTYKRRSRLLLTEIKKAMKNPRASDLLDINKIGFITEKTLGVPDGLEFEYEVINFDKIIEFNGNYVIKFLAKVIVGGDNIFEKYKLEELELRYVNKEPKNL